jgi:hypothetical protein
LIVLIYKLIILDSKDKNYISDYFNKMGCGVSKKNINNPNISDKAVTHSRLVAANQEEDEIQVLQPGKNIPKGDLDDVITSRDLGKNILKGSDEASIILNVSYTLKNSKTEVSNTDPVKERELDENMEAEEVIELSKSKTFNKIGFESHPHEFDFSFIKESPKVQNETVNITDEVLKEISEIRN